MTTNRRAVSIFAVVIMLLSATASVAQQKKLPNIVILATGGTIAGAAATGHAGRLYVRCCND